MPTRVRSHAKINLGLFLGPLRSDGFHALTTVYQTLDIRDVVTITARRAPATILRLTSNDRRVPTDSSNTAWKMILLALEELGLTAEWEIHIEKRLPVQGGLGAGLGPCGRGVGGAWNRTWNSGSSRSASQRVSLACRPSSGKRSKDGGRGLPGPNVEWRSPPRLALTCRCFSSGRGAGPGSRTGSLSASRLRARLVRGRRSRNRAFLPRSLSRLGRALRRRGFDQEAREDRLEKLSRAYASAFREHSEGGQRPAPRVLPRKNPIGRTWPDPRSPRLSAPGSRAGSRTTSSELSFPSILPLQKIKRLLRAPVRRRQLFAPCCRAPVRRFSGCTKTGEMRKRQQSGSRSRSKG